MQQLLAAFDTGGILAEHIAPLRERLASMLETVSDSAETSAGASASSAPPPGPARRNTSRPSPRRSWNAGASHRIQRPQQRHTSQREISPQRLTHYRDNWYLDAWCHLRDELRSFAVDAIKTVKTIDIAASDIPESRTRRSPRCRLRHLCRHGAGLGRASLHP
jgi:hypothetical protein